ncbi:MAG: hypothetical protein AAGC66_08005 [Leifsonia sp.]
MGSRKRDGLSRRGWMLLVGITASVGVALLVVGVLTILPLVGFVHQAAAATSTADSPPGPSWEPGPTPLGLPPRPTATHVATEPAQPLTNLKPGACLQTYDSKWADAFPVVDCSAPHIAQLLATGALPQSAGAAFPGTDALDAQVTDLCSPHLDWHWVAIWGEDVFTDLRYPDTAAKWATGDRTYYCFVFTYSRHELTGSALAQP